MENRKVLSNIHQLQYPDKGQNYVFNGCMKYLMECMDERDEYDYYYFSFISGDCTTQVFGHNKDKWYPCLSQSHFDYDLIERVFNSIGYSFTYVDNIELNDNKEKYRQKIISYIDRGIPVIGKGFNGFWDDKVWLTEEVSCIVGYENEGETFFRLPEEATDLMPISLDDDYPYSLVFVEDRISEPSLADSYKSALFNIPDLLILPAKEDVSFGLEAFSDWAQAITGNFYNIPEQEYDFWRLYTIYVCIIATNQFSQQFVNRVFELNPELVFYKVKIDKVYEEMEESYGLLNELGGGFNITYEKLQDASKCKEIADVIMMYRKHYEKLSEVIKGINPDN